MQRRESLRIHLAATEGYEWLPDWRPAPRNATPGVAGSSTLPSRKTTTAADSAQSRSLSRYRPGSTEGATLSDLVRPRALPHAACLRVSAGLLAPSTQACKDCRDTPISAPTSTTNGHDGTARPGVWLVSGRHKVDTDPRSPAPGHRHQVAAPGRVPGPRA